MNVPARVKLFGSLAVVVALAGTARAGEGWPSFRGPRGDGSVTSDALPLEWSDTEGVRWKTAIPHLGWSTPVVLEGRVWLTSATKDGRDRFAFCVDAESGRIVVTKQLFHCDKPEPLSNGVNCYASPSPAIEPGRVYVNFGSYGTACLDSATGDVLWKRTDLPCRHYRGPGSSVILYRDTLILTMDGVDVQYVAALDKRTGETVWRTNRDVDWKDLDANGKPHREGDYRKGFATPLVIEVGGAEQLVSPASMATIAYEPRTGREIWRVTNGGYTPTITPVFGSGLVWAGTGYRSTELIAMRPGGTGDVTDSHVAWRVKGRDVPTTPSPVVIDGLLYMMSNKGTLTCFEAASGKPVYRERIDGNYLASPIHDGRRIWYSNTIGKTTVIRAGRTFEKLAENKLAAGFMASPAVTSDSLILRTKTHLYRVDGK